MKGTWRKRFTLGKDAEKYDLGEVSEAALTAPTAAQGMTEAQQCSRQLRSASYSCTRTTHTPPQNQHIHMLPAFCIL